MTKHRNEGEHVTSEMRTETNSPQLSTNSAKIAEVILQHLIYQFKEQSLIIINEFAEEIFSKATPRSVVDIVDASMFTQEGPIEGDESLMINTQGLTRQTDVQHQVFEQLLASFVNVSKHSVDSIVEALYDWRVHFDLKLPQNILVKIEEFVKTQGHRSIERKKEILQQIYLERKELAVDYIFCYTIVILLGTHQVSVNSVISEKLEDLCFANFKNAFNKMEQAKKLNNSIILESKKIVQERYAELIGLLSTKRFSQITEKFMQNIPEKETSNINRNHTVNFIRGMRYLKLQILKSEDVDKSVAFLNKIHDYIVNKRRGYEIKIAVCESLVNMLSPLAAIQLKEEDKNIYAEWYAILEKFHNYAKRLKKHKYNMIVHPFVSTILCLSEEKIFMQHFPVHMQENLLKHAKSADKALKLMALDCILHVLGSYLKIMCNKNQDEKTSRAVTENLQKIMHSLLTPGKKNVPNVAANDAIYSALVDIIVMIANSKLDFALNDIVLELLLKSENLLSENVLLGLRAFMEIADEHDVRKITSLLGDDRKPMSKYPVWMLKLLEKTNRRASLGNIRTNSDEIDLNATVRIVSPFSSYRTVNSNLGSMSTLGTLSTLGVSTLSRVHNIKLLANELGIHPHQEKLSEALSAILKNCDRHFGSSQFLLTNKAKQLQEMLSKDKYSCLCIFETAISCIPRLIPSEFKPPELTDLLGKCVIHQDKGLRETAWDVMLQLMDFRAELRPSLIHSFVEMITTTISDFKYNLLEQMLSKLITLLKKWKENLEAKIKTDDQGPTIYGSMQSNVKFEFEPVRVEATSLVLLCNVAGHIRLYGYRILQLVRDITKKLYEKESKQMDTMIADVFDEKALHIARRLMNLKQNGLDKSMEQVKQPIHNIEEFIKNCDSQLYPAFLREIAKLVSDFCPVSSKIAFITISKRVLKYNERLEIIYRAPVMDETLSIIELWKNFITFACATAVRESSNIAEDVRRRSGEIQSPKDLYQYILPHLRSNNEIQIQAAVDALGGTHEAMVDSLLEQLKVLENEAFDRKKIRKKNTQLRIQISRVYSRISDFVRDSIFAENEFIRERFLNFITEQISFLKLPSVLYSIDMQPLRYHTFIVIENFAKKLHYYQPPPESKPILDVNKRADLLLFIMRWSGFGESNSVRETEEEINLNQITEKMNRPEEKKSYQEAYKKKDNQVNLKACSAIAALSLGKFFVDDIKSLVEWSEQTRIDAKQHEHMAKESKPREKITKSLTRTNSYGLPFIFQTQKKDDSDESHSSHGSLSNYNPEYTALTFCKWIDEILCSNDETSRQFGVQALSNVLETNGNILSLYIDQCYHCNENISFGYFQAIVNAFEKKDIPCQVGEILMLILYQVRSKNKETRNRALDLLDLISVRFFNVLDEQPIESGNYPYTLSSDLLDAFDDIQNSLSNKLAQDHKEYAQDILLQVYARLPFVSDSNQRASLKCLVPWIEYLNLENKRMEMKQETKESESPIIEYVPNEKPNILNILFELTRIYGHSYSRQCREMWSKVAKDLKNVKIVIEYFIDRFTKDEDVNEEAIKVAQKITYYLSVTAPECTINTLMEELRKTRDGSHYRQTSPDFSQMNSKMGLLAPQLILILLVEVAYKHVEPFRPHLPLLLQYLFIQMDHERPIIYENAKLLLLHLLHSFIIRRIPNNTIKVEEMERLYETKELMKQIMEQKGKSLWKQDSIDEMYPIFGVLDVKKSVKKMSLFMEKVLKVFSLEHEIRSRWASEALLWATKRKFIHTVLRSYQIYRTLKPELKRKDILSIIDNLRKYLMEMSDLQTTTAIIIEIITTIRVIIGPIKNKLILYPEIFWLCISLLHSDMIHIYTHALQLLSELFDHLDISSTEVQHVLWATRIHDSELPFHGIQPLVLKGLLHHHSEPIAIGLLSKFIKMTNDPLFDTSGSRLLMNIMGLLPWLCLNISNDGHECFKVAAKISEACEHYKLRKIAKVFTRFAKGVYETLDKFLLDLRKPMSEFFFSQHEEEIFNLLLQFLECGPENYRGPVLSIMHSFLLHVDVKTSNIYQKNNYRLITAAASMLDGPLWQEATRVLDVAVRSCSRGMKDKIKINTQYETQSNTLKKQPIPNPFTNKSGDGTKKVIMSLELIFKKNKNKNEKTISNLLCLFEESGLNAKLDETDSRIISPNDLDVSISSDDLTEESEITTDTDTMTNLESEKFRIYGAQILDYDEENPNLKEFEETLKEQLSKMKEIQPYPNLGKKVVKQKPTVPHSNSSRKKFKKQMNL